MPSYIKCRKCREVLCSNYGEPTGSTNCTRSRVLFDECSCPEWIQSLIEERNAQRGKLHCPKCGAKLGSFDFSSAALCECGVKHSNIWLIASKLDIMEGSPSHTTKPLETNKDESVVRKRVTKQSVLDSSPEYSDAETSISACEPADSTGREVAFLPNETLELGKKKVSEVALTLTRKGRECVANLCAGLSSQAENNEEAHVGECSGASFALCGEYESPLSPNETLELGRKKVSEVALTITRKGRECVANLCAGLSVDANLSEETDQKTRPTPVTTDDETEPSQNELGAQSLKPLINSAFGDNLPHSQDDGSREPVPPTEMQPSTVDGNVSSNEEDSGNTTNEVNPEPFTCSVCLEIYYLPQKCDPCEHVFCDPCLRQVNSSTSGVDVKCPLCRKIIKKCSTYEDLWKATKVLFPAEYQERHKVERKKRRNRASLPGSINGSRSRANRRANGGGSNVLAMWAGVCFVLLFMMLGFTVFATTVGFVAWYFLEVAMDLLVDVTLEFQTFSEILKTSIILFCIDGRLSEEKWNILYDSAGRVLGAFTKLVHTRNTSHNAAEIPLTAHTGDSPKPYQMLWKITQTNLANYVVFGCLVTFIMYRLAKFMQARRA